MGSDFSDSQALARGLLIGDDSALSNEIQDLFSAAGIQHLTAASGANLALVGLLAQPLLHRLRWPGTVVLFLIYAWYWQVTGGSSSLWRASVQASGILLAKTLGRELSPFLALVLTIFFGFFVDSDYFRKIGFWLSVAACFGLIFSRNILSGENKSQLLSQKQRMIFPLFQTLATGTYVTIFVLPILWYFFGEITVVGAFSTPLAGLFVPPLQVLGGMSFGFDVLAEEFVAVPQLCLLWLYQIFIDFLRLFVSFTHSWSFVMISGVWFLTCFLFTLRVFLFRLIAFQQRTWWNRLRL